MAQLQTVTTNTTENFIPILFYLLYVDTGNSSPLISFDSPSISQMFTQGLPVFVAASENDSDSTIFKLDLYVNNVIISSGVQPPYTMVELDEK